MLNIIKDYVNNDDQFTWKMAISQDKFLDLVNLVLTTTWYNFNSQFYQQTDGVAMGGPASSITATYMEASERTAITTALHPSKVWEQFVDDMYSILKCTHLENFFLHIKILHQNIKFTAEEEYSGELAFLDTLLKRIMKGSLCWYIENLHILTSSHYQTSCKESVVSSLFNRAYFIITNKDDLHKENNRRVVSSLFNIAYFIITNIDDVHKEKSRIKQVLKENGYQESIISKIFKNYQQSQLVSVTTTSASHRYPRGRDQNEYKFIVR